MTMINHPNHGYFIKRGSKYIGPSGKKFDLAQVQMFYANHGKFPGEKASSVRKGWRIAQTPAHQAAVRRATHGKHL